MKKVVKTILFLVNLVFAILLACSYLAAWVSPATFYLIGFLGLAYPFLFIINIFFLLFWLIMFKKYFLLSLIVILIRIDYIPSFFQLSNKQEEPQQAQQLRIMSFNVHSFRHMLEWRRDVDNMDKTIDLIQEWQPNIICIQEFFSSTKKGSSMNVIERIKKELPIKYHYIPVRSKKENSVSGNIIFSAFPILQAGVLEESPNSHRLIFADLVMEEDTLRFYNLHLTSFKLDDDDAKTLSEITENHNFEKDKGRTILRKIRTAQRFHGIEVDFLQKHIEACPYKVFICGDFNDTPSSYPYQQLSRGRKDVFREKGKGFGNTYNGRFPAFRIDYILHDKSYKALSFKEKPANYSDHFPLFAELEKQ